MGQSKKYIAAAVPRFLRQSRLGYLPMKSIIGSQLTGGKNNSLYFDIVMLPAMEFQRLRSNVGLQPLMAPQPTPGDSSFKPGFVINNAKEVSVPAAEPDPEAFAKNHFLKLFGISDEKKATVSEQSAFQKSAKEHTNPFNYIKLQSSKS